MGQVSDLADRHRPGDHAPMQPPDSAPAAPAVAAVPAPLDGQRLDRDTYAKARRALAGVFIRGALDDADRFVNYAEKLEKAGKEDDARVWRDLAVLAHDDAKRATLRIKGVLR